jgi:hypothetical protein
MKHEVKFWEDHDLRRGRHIATLVVDEGTFYNDWETADSDPGYFVIGKEGMGKAALRDYGSMYLYEQILSVDPLLLCNWRINTGSLSVGMSGYGTIYTTTPSSWNKTSFQCEVTRKVS